MTKSHPPEGEASVDRDNKLDETTMLLHRLAARSPDMLYRMSLPEGRYEYVSEASQAITGYSPSEFIDRPQLVGEIVHPDWREYFEHHWALALSGEIPPTSEFQVIHRSGEIRWLNQRNTLLKNQEGIPQALEGVVTDVTKQKEMEAELHDTLGILKAAIAQSPSGIIVADAPDVTIRFANAQALGIRGGDGRLLTNIDVSQHADRWQTYHVDGTPYSPEDLPLSRAVMLGETIGNEEVIIRDGSGTDHWVVASAAPIRDSSGNVTAGIVVFHDITDRKGMESQRALEQSRRRLEQLIQSIPVAVFVSDPQGVPQFVNRAAIAILGQGLRPDAETEELAEIYHAYIAGTDDLYPVERMPLVRALSGEESTVDDMEIDHPSGRKALLVSATPVVSENGEIEYSIASFIDITDRRNAELQLKRAHEKLEASVRELERSNQELEQFAYVASHDLQEPLRMVSSFTQLLEERYSEKLDGEAKRYIHFAVDGANRMQRLIQDLLSYSRIQTRGHAFEQVDSHSCLGQARTNLSAMIQEASAVVTNDELPIVTADHSQLALLFQNLVANAIKFRGEETHVFMFLLRTRVLSGCLQ